MRTNLTKLAMAVWALAWVSGCSCDPGSQCEDIFVSFESPKDGATGVPATTDVSVKVANNAGQSIELESATLVSRATTATEFSVPRNGTISSTGVSFTGVTLEPGPNLIKVTVTKKGSTCTGTKSITVEVPTANDPPKVLTFAYPQDTAMPMGTLNSVELPSSAMLRIDLATQFAIGGTVEIINTANNMVLGSSNISNSAVSVQVPSAALADNGYTLFAKITKGTLSNTQTGNPDAVKSITLARTAPTCAMTLPAAAALGPNDDADATTTGFQIRAAGTAGSTATGLEIKITGGAAPGTSGVKAPVAGGISNDFTVPSAGTVAYTLTLEAKDANGNLCTATKMVTVDFDPPVCAITSPTSAGSPYTSFNIPLTTMVTGGNGGTVSFQTSLPMQRDISPVLAVTNGASAPFTASFTNGAQTVTATCTDAAGNKATTTQNITVNATTGCSVYFTRPATKPALVTTAAYNFIVQTSCPTQMVTLKQTGAANKTIAADASGQALFTVTGLTNGNYTFTAEVGTPVSSDSVAVTVDLNAPVITRPLLASGKTYALLNVAADLAPGTAGAQTQLAYTATVPVGGRVDVCTNSVPAAPGGPCADGLAGWSTLKTSAAANEPMFTFPEGQYSIKIVIVVGTTVQATSDLVDIVSDVTAPAISNVKLVRDANNDKMLNIAEIAGMSLQVSFDVGASNPASTIGLVEVRDTVAYNNAMGVGNVGQAYTVTLNQNLTPPVESNFTWTVEVTDLNLNKTTVPFTGVRIDQVAPSCVVTQPSGILYGGPGDASSSMTGYQIVQTVTTSADVMAPTMTLSGGQMGTASPSAAGSVATNVWNLTQTSGTQTYAFAATCSDISGNPTTATAKTGVVVDLDAPTCTITAPTASPPQYLNFGVSTAVSVTGAATPQSVRVFSQPTAGLKALRANLPIVGTSASGTVSYVGGVQAVTAEVDDPAGNTGTCGPVSIDVNASGCDIAFTSPVLVNGKAFLTAAPFTVSGHSTNCAAGKNVTLFNVVGAVTTSLGTGITDVNGNVMVNGTLTDATGYTLRLEIDNGGGVLNHVDLTPITVDTIAPTVGTASPTGATLNFVSASNGNLPNAAYVADLVAGGNAEFNVSLTNVVGALNGTVKIFFKGAQVGSNFDITADPQPSISFQVTLPHNDSGTFEIRVADEAGNTVKPTNAAAAIDVIAPAAPTVTLMRTSVRAATMALSWGPTYDDGAVVASGANAGYDIRWSTDAVLNANQLATSTDYFDPAKAFVESLEPWAAGTINRNLTLPPLNTYYIVVRAKDELGNYSAYVAPTGFDNTGTKDALVNPTGTGAQAYGVRVSANGSLNADAIDDLVTASSPTNTVYVYFGRTGFTGLTGTCSSPNCQAIPIPVASSGDTFGTEFAIGNAGDTAAPDLLVGSPNFSSSTGRAFLFFGGATPIDTATFIEFRGASAGPLFGRIVAILPDINKDGIGEIAIWANENAGRAKVYIYKGRTKAAWQAALVGGFIPTTSADAVIEGPSPISGNTFFGFSRGGYTSLGDIDGDTNVDFTIADAKDNINKVFLFSGATVSASTPAVSIKTGIAPGIQSDTLQELTTTGVGTGGSSGFGFRTMGGVNFFGASGNDLFVSQPQQNRVLLYSDIVLPVGSPNVTITGSNAFGSGGALGKFRGATTTDIVIGESSPTAVSAAWIFYSRTNTYDTAAGSFWQSTISGPSSGTTGAFAANVATGDFDNDSNSDVAIADPTTSPGRVMVWH